MYRFIRHSSVLHERNLLMITQTRLVCEADDTAILGLIEPRSRTVSNATGRRDPLTDLISRLEQLIKRYSAARIRDN